MNNLKKIKNTYDNLGFIIIKKILSKEELKLANRSLIKFVSINKKSLKGRDINFADGQNVNSIHMMQNWTWVKKIRKNNILKKIIPILLEDKAVDFGAELFAKPAKVGLAAPMHQDNYYWAVDNSKGLTVWVALHDSDKTNGGVYYFEKSQKLGILEHKLSYAPGSSQTLKYPDGMKTFTKTIPKIMAGDCIIHDCRTVHGSNPNKSKFPRTGVTVRFIGKSSKIDNYQKAKYERELKYNIQK